MRKVVIIGARAGSTLLLECLKTRLKDWSGSKRETPIVDWIRNNYPKTLPENLLEHDWEITKAGELAFYLNDILRIYNPKVIYLSRPVYQRINSHMGVGYANSVFNIYKNNKKLAQEMDNFLPKKNIYMSLTKIDRLMYLDAAWFLLMRHKTLAHFSKVKVVEFKDLMKHFKRTMMDISEFIGIEYDPRWENMRKKRWQRSANKSNVWIGQDWK